MKKSMIIVGTLLALLAAALPALATTRLQKLSEDRYLITHQKQTNLGGQGKALRLANEKAGSLCVVLGYKWFEVRDSHSKGRTWGSGAGATLEVKFYKKRPNDDANDCEALATEEQKQKMREALDKMKH